MFQPFRRSGLAEIAGTEQQNMLIEDHQVPALHEHIFRLCIEGNGIACEFRRVAKNEFH